MRRLWMIAGIASLVISGMVCAQETEGSGSGESLVSEAEQAVKRVETVIAEGEQMLSDAQSESDVTRMACLNTELVSARGFLNVVQNGEANLRDAVSRHDQSATQHHYKLVQLAVARADSISGRMMKCNSGVKGNVFGETRSETTRKCAVEPCLGGEEYDAPPLAPNTIMTDASPYL